MPPHRCDPAKALATALDHEDYPAATAQLSPACVYEIRGETIEGAEAIIASYQINGDGAKERFDNVTYESAVTPLSEGRARIDYTDIVTRAGETHTHRCAQEVRFDADGLVTHILHIDLEDEREALAAFLARHL